MPKQSPEVLAAVEQYGTYVSKPKAAEIACCSVRTINRSIEAGDLPLYRVGRTRTYRVKTEDVVNLLTRVA
ncbi:MAG: hypothetical protein Q4G46_00210 [Propionibacteriaceae bacterium]|nr:hypothetical protein [Propionibacteriaceae bacterium]